MEKTINKWGYGHWSMVHAKMFCFYGRWYYKDGARYDIKKRLPRIIGKRVPVISVTKIATTALHPYSFPMDARVSINKTRRR